MKQKTEQSSSKGYPENVQNDHPVNKVNKWEKKLTLQLSATTRSKLPVQLKAW